MPGRQTACPSANCVVFWKVDFGRNVPALKSWRTTSRKPHPQRRLAMREWPTVIVRSGGCMAPRRLCRGGARALGRWHELLPSSGLPSPDGHEADTADEEDPEDLLWAAAGIFADGAPAKRWPWIKGTDGESCPWYWSWADRHTAEEPDMPAAGSIAGSTAQRRSTLLPSPCRHVSATRQAASLPLALPSTRSRDSRVAPSASPPGIIYLIMRRAAARPGRTQSAGLSPSGKTGC